MSDDLVDRIGDLIFRYCEAGNCSEQEMLDSFDEMLKELSSFAFEEFQARHARLSEVLHKRAWEAFPMLLLFFERKRSRIANKTRSSITLAGESDMTADQFQSVFESILGVENGKQYCIHSLAIPKFDDQLSEALRPWVVELLNHVVSIPTKRADLQADLATFGVLLGMLRRIGKTSGELGEFYFQFASVLERLSRDGHNQVARDFAEEAIFCSFLDEKQYFGHFCRFSLSAQQRNPIDALLNAGLLLANLEEAASIPEHLLKRISFVSFALYRNIGFRELAEKEFHVLENSFDNNEYEEQANFIAYLNMLLAFRDPVALDVAEIFVRERFERIKAFENSAAEPWFVALCNLRIIFGTKFDSKSALIKVERWAERILDAEQLSSLRSHIVPGRVGAKSTLIEQIDRLSLARRTEDHIHDVNLLQSLAANVLRLSIESQDYEGILLSHRIKSDGSLAFELSENMPRSTLLAHTSEYLSSTEGRGSLYFQKVVDCLVKHPQIRFVWLGFDGEKPYFMFFEDARFVAAGHIPAVSRSDVRKWLLRELPTLGFDDNPRTVGPMETRDDIWKNMSKEIREKLPKLHLPYSKKHTQVFCDIEIACFPHNFLSDPSKEDSIQRLCNPLSLDKFMTYSPKKIDVSKISIWAPLSEGDFAVAMAHEILMRHLHGRAARLASGIVPDSDDVSDLKVFICHGGRDFGKGFSGLYPSDGRKYNSNEILGVGKVAVLFVCHGGLFASNLFSNSFHALVKDLLRNGYETVIAPSWSLNIVIPGAWMELFLRTFDCNENIVEAAQAANDEIRRVFPVESAWCALHVYGNPFITGNSMRIN